MKYITLTLLLITLATSCGLSPKRKGKKSTSDANTCASSEICDVNIESRSYPIRFNFDVPKTGSSSYDVQKCSTFDSCLQADNIACQNGFCYSTFGNTSLTTTDNGSTLTITESLGALSLSATGTVRVFKR